jgi:hypothetical protein
MRAGREMSKVHLERTWVGLSTGHVTSARWRHQPPIFATGAFRDFQKR